MEKHNLFADGAETQALLMALEKIEQMVLVNNAHILGLKTQIEQIGKIEIHNHLSSSTSNSQSYPTRQQPPSTVHEITEEPCLFIHPSIDSNQEWQIHHEIKRLVKRQRIQDICLYLRQMRKENKVLLPQSPSVAYAELVRMGMPQGEGYNENTLRKYYTHK